MKPKLIILTESSWWDTDVTIIPHLLENFDVEVFLVAEKSNNKFTSSEILSFEQRLNLKVNVWKRQRRIRSVHNFLFFLKLFLGLYKKIKKPNTWIYYISMYDPYINFFSIFLKKSNTLIGIHDYRSHAGMDGRIRTILKNLLYQSFRFFQFFSNLEDSQFKLDYPQKKSFFIEMPLKTYGNQLLNLNIDLKQGYKVFLFFGYIRHYKGLDILLNAINQGILKDEKFILLIAGNADDFKTFEPLLAPVMDKIYSRIEFIDNSLIPSYFNLAHFLILPYRTATQSGPLLLGLNYNLPVIASNLDCFKECVTHGEDGYLFEKEDVSDLAKCIYNATRLSEVEYNKLKTNQLKKADYINSKSINIGNIFFDKLVSQNF